jgi:hypothetical protein
MEPLGPLATSRLAERAGDFERSLDRAERPEHRRQVEGVRIELRLERRRRRSQIQPGPRRHQPDDTVATVGHDQASRRGHRNPGGGSEQGLPSRTVGEPPAAPRHRPLTAGRGDFDDATGSVGGKHRTVRCDGDCERTKQHVRAVGNRRDDPVWKDDSDRAVSTVGHEDVAGGIHGNAAGRVKPAVRAVFEARTSRAGKRSHRPIRVDCHDPIVVGVGDDDASPGVDGYADRAIEASVAPDDRRHGSIRGDSADRVIARVGHEQIAVGVESEAGWRLEPGG